LGDALAGQLPGFKAGDQVLDFLFGIKAIGWFG